MLISWAFSSKTFLNFDSNVIKIWSQGPNQQRIRFPDSKVHVAHLGPVGPRWAPCWPHEPCYQGYDLALERGQAITWSNKLNKLIPECTISQASWHDTIPA